MRLRTGWEHIFKEGMDNLKIEPYLVANLKGTGFKYDKESNKRVELSINTQDIVFTVIVEDMNIRKEFKVLKSIFEGLNVSKRVELYFQACEYIISQIWNMKHNKQTAKIAEYIV